MLRREIIHKWDMWGNFFLYILCTSGAPTSHLSHLSPPRIVVFLDIFGNWSNYTDSQARRPERGPKGVLEEAVGEWIGRWSELGDSWVGLKSEPRCNYIPRHPIVLEKSTPPWFRTSFHENAWNMANRSNFVKIVTFVSFFWNVLLFRGTKHKRSEK